MMRYAAARKLAEEVGARTRFVLGLLPLGWEAQLFHRLLTLGLVEALDAQMRWSREQGYMLSIWWMEGVAALAAEVEGEAAVGSVDGGWRWASAPPESPRQVLATDGDGAYYVAVYDAGGMGESDLEAGAAGCWGGAWVDAHSEEVLEVAAWREVPRWDKAEMPRRAGHYDGGFEGGRGDA